MIGVKYCGTYTDYSGYGQANRNFITAFFMAQVRISTELVVQVQERGNFGWVGALCSTLQNQDIPYKIKIIHLTPDMYPRYMEPGKYHIGHLFWETDQLPTEWVGPCNQMDEIWTASEKQAEMIKASGVTTPIKWFPQPLDILPQASSHPPFVIPNFEGFAFYSIFQWIERKNPKALLTAYWKAFQGKKDVVLVVKSYRVNYSDKEFNLIKEDINRWKNELGLSEYPRVILCKKLLDTQDMFRLHSTGNCYINASRGEGWCIPAVEAQLMGKPVISINKTGFADYMDESRFYPCDTFPAKVKQVTWIPWYTSKQNWLEISETDLMNQMITVYNNKKKAKEVGKKGQAYVMENFNYWAVGEAMKNRLEEIEKFL